MTKVGYLSFLAPTKNLYNFYLVFILIFVETRHGVFYHKINPISQSPLISTYLYLSLYISINLYLSSFISFHIRIIRAIRIIRIIFIPLLQLSPSYKSSSHFYHHVFLLKFQQNLSLSLQLGHIFLLFP